MSAKKEMTFDEKLSRIEKITQILDSEGLDNMDFEKMLTLYEEGAKLCKECAEYMKNAELRIVDISKQTNINDIEF